MKNAEQYELTISQATAVEALKFIEAAAGIGINHIWHIRRPFQEKVTHTVYLELTCSLNDAKTMLSSVASANGLSLEWRLLPQKL